MHRFFVPSSSLSAAYLSSADPELIHQLRDVLKMRLGQRCIVLDNAEQEVLIELTELSKAHLTAKILEKKLKPDISSQKAIHLFVPPLKNPSRWEWLLEKCTEIGVASFTPLITARTEVQSLRKLDRLDRIIKEAAEQSGRSKLAEIREPMTFEAVIKHASGAANLIACFHPSAEPIHALITQETTNVQLFIGPVGDFTEHEITAAIAAGFQPISLGTQILRTETAAVVGSTLLLNQDRDTQDLLET